MLNCNKDNINNNNNNNNNNNILLLTLQTALYCNIVFTVLSLITLRIRRGKLRSRKQ
jgi:hypothetical protein